MVGPALSHGTCWAVGSAPFRKCRRSAGYAAGPPLDRDWSVGRRRGGAGIAGRPAELRHCREMTGRTDRYSRGTPEVRRKYCTSARSSRRRQPLAGHALQPNNCQRGAAKVLPVSETSCPSTAPGTAQELPRTWVPPRFPHV